MQACRVFCCVVHLVCVGELCECGFVVGCVLLCHVRWFVVSCRGCRCSCCYCGRWFVFCAYCRVSVG